MPKVLSKRDKAIKQKILNAANAIRQKYLSLKLERSGEDDALNKILNPIKEPLTKIVENTELTKVKAEKDDILKKEEEKEEEKSYREQDVTLKEPKFLTTKYIGEMGQDNEFEEEESHGDGNDDDELQKSISERSPVYLEYLNQYPPIAQEYIDKYFRDPEKIDLTYGLSHDKTIDMWRMGSERLTFNANGDIKIGSHVYRGTRGLYELIFMKVPMYPTRGDEAEYREILNQTNAHRRDNNPSAQIKGSNSVKYKQYIQPLFSAKSVAAKLNQQRKRISSAPSKTGSGLLKYTKKPKEYVYYDDVNELVDRLTKLNASQDAGNGNNINEIMSILEELRELDVIEFI